MRVKIFARRDCPAISGEELLRAYRTAVSGSHDFAVFFPANLYPNYYICRYYDAGYGVSKFLSARFRRIF